MMKSTKTIQLEIYPDKVEDFYFSLLQCKISSEANVETLKKLLDCIHFDHTVITENVELIEQKLSIINNKLLAVHQQLFNAQKNSSQYLEVSRADFDTFKKSPFCNELEGVFLIAELFEKLRGKDETAEAKAAIVLLSYFILNIANVLLEDWDWR